MPIVDYSFIKVGLGSPRRPMLPIRIINPATDKSFSTYGLIDIGADECALPTSYAKILGHNLLTGKAKEIITGNGITKAYAHITRIQILDKTNPAEVVYTINDMPVDFMPNLQTVLLGAKNFLSNFTLVVNYPVLISQQSRVL